MQVIELSIVALLFLSSFVLVFKDLKFSLFVLLILSLLLHKELFSFYRWDIMPVRLFMLALSSVFVLKFALWWKKEGSVSKIVTYVKDPLVLFLLLLWFFRLVSLVNSQNFMSSIFLLAFFTTIVVLGLVLYKYLRRDPEAILRYLRFYIWAVFGLCLTAFIQLAIYLRTDFIFGALWNVPGHIPRLGSLFWDVNHFGGLLAGLLPLVGMFVLTSEKFRTKAVYVLSMIPMTAVLLLTNSRTAWISAAVAVMVFVTVLLVRRFGYKGILAVLLATVLLSIPVLVEYSDRSSPFRARVKQYFNYRIDSFDSHLLLIRGAWQIFEKNPYIGGGYGSFYEQFGKTQVAAEFYTRDPAAFSVRVPAHTIWGELVAETGILGLVAFTGFVLAGLLPLLYLAVRSSDKKTALLSAGMSSGVIGWLSAGIFYSYNAEFFWLVFFLYFLYGIAVLGEKRKDAYLYFIRSKKLPVVLLSLLAVVLIFWGLGSNHLLVWDEAIYAKISKNMVQTGEYVVMTWDPAKIWYEKPPLFMWMMAFSMKVLGISELSARLPSALAGLGTILLMYFFGKHMFRNRYTGLVAAFALLTTFNFLYYSRASMLDVTSTFFITLSLFFYWRLKSFDIKGGWVLTGLSLGAAILVKGATGIIPLGVIGLYELYLYATKQQKITVPLVTGYVFLLIASVLVFLPWHWEMYRQFGSSFIDNYIGYHVLDRATTAIEDKGNPFWWYTIVMKVSMRIWFIALIPALIWSVIRVAKKDKKHAFLLIWGLVVFLLFSVAQSKLKWYIMPIYPVASLIVAVFIEKLVSFFGNYFRGEKVFFFRSGTFILLVVFGLFYLFLNKDLVYESDQTGYQATLLERKDLKFGTDVLVYLDRVDLPLALYYTDGPFIMTDFKDLRNKISGAGSEDSDDIIFITRESRFRSIAEEVEGVSMVEGNKYYVLGVWSKIPPIDPTALQPVLIPVSE